MRIRPSLLLLAALPCSHAAANELDALPVRQWTSVGVNTISNVQPCPAGNCSYSINGVSNTIDAWCGGGFATRPGAAGYYLAGWCGGHQSYSGNEIYFFDVETLTWSRSHTPPYDGVSFAGGFCGDSGAECCNDGTLGCKGYPDQPCANHSYALRGYSPQSNKYVNMREMCGSRSSGWDFDHSRWFRSASGPSPALPSVLSTSLVFDARRNRLVWLGTNLGGGYLTAYDIGRDTWTTGVEALINGRDTNADNDPTRDVAVLVNLRPDSGSRQVLGYDLGNLAAPPIVLNTSPDTNTFLPGQSGPGFRWDPVSDAFVLWPCDPSGTSRPATSVCKLTPPAGDWKSGTWTWSEVTAAAGNGVTPPLPRAADPNYVYTRFQYVPSKNVFLYVGDVNERVYAFRLTAASAAPQCIDGRDNDGDGLVDLADPDCASPLAVSEGATGGPPAPPASVWFR